MHQNHCLLPGADETRTFCFISDAVDALIKLSKLDLKNWDQIFHVGSDEELSILDAATIIAEQMGKPRSIIVPERSFPEVCRGDAPTSIS